MCFVYHATGPASLGSGRPPFHMGQTLEIGSNTSMTFSSHARQDTIPYSKLSKRRNSNQPQRISSSNLNCSRYRDTSATAATPLSLSFFLSVYICLCQSSRTRYSTRKPQIGIKTIRICLSSNRSICAYDDGAYAEMLAPQLCTLGGGC